MTKLEEIARIIDDSRILQHPTETTARGIIECLMEPDEAMLKAAWEASEFDFGGFGLRRLGAEHNKPIWQAMLRAVLDEQA